MGIFSQFSKGLGFVSWEVKILIYLVQSSREQRFRVCGAGPAEIVEFILRYSLLVIIIEYISIHFVANFLWPIYFVGQFYSSMFFLKNKQASLLTLGYCDLSRLKEVFSSPIIIVLPFLLLLPIIPPVLC